MNTLVNVSSGLLALLLVYLFLTPFLIYAIQRFNRDMRILTFDPDEIPKSSRITRFFDDSIEEMQEIGFECLGEYTIPDMPPNVTVVLQIYRNTQTRESAMVTSMWTTGPQLVELRQNYAEFVCRFQNDDVRLIQTNNTTRPGAFDDDPHELSFRLPQLRSTLDLYVCHTRLIGRHQPNARRVLRLDEEFGGDAEEFLRQTLIEDFDRQLTTGYLQKCDAGWRPTVYGAFRMTWKELWPFISIRTKLLETRGLALETDLEQEFGPIHEG